MHTHLTLIEMLKIFKIIIFQITNFREWDYWKFEDFFVEMKIFIIN